MSRFKRNVVFACFIFVFASIALFRIAYDNTVETTANSAVMEDDSAVAHGGHGHHGHHSHQHGHHNDHHHLNNHHGWNDHRNNVGEWNGNAVDHINPNYNPGTVPVTPVVAPATVQYQTLPDYHYYVPARTSSSGTSSTKVSPQSTSQHK